MPDTLEATQKDAMISLFLFFCRTSSKCFKSTKPLSNSPILTTSHNASLNDTSLESGVFYASKSGITGQIVDQGTLFNDFHNVVYQNNARESIHRFIN